MQRLRDLQRFIPIAHHYIFRVTYFRVHLFTIVSLALIGGLVLWGLERNNTQMTFIDSLFVATSSLTTTGLTTQNIQLLRLDSQIFMVFLIFVGGMVFRSYFPLVYRAFVFRQSVKKITEKLGETKENALTERLDLEYRSLKLLLIVIPLYVLISMFLGAVVLVIAFAANSGYYEPLETRNISSAWASTFLSISAFCNAGFSPVDDNLMSLSYNPPLLITLSVLIALGNTCYPIVLRFILKLLSYCSPRLNETCTWLLAHSRLCYTHLFGSKVTFYLLSIVMFFDITQFALATGEDWTSPVLYPYANSTGLKLANLVLTTFSTRSAGFNSLNMMILAPSVQFYLLFLIYINSYPIATSLRMSMTTEEEQEFDQTHRDAKTLDKEDLIKLQELSAEIITIEEQLTELARKKQPRYLAVFKNLMVRDVAVVFFAVIIIAMVEKPNFYPYNPNGDPTFSLFSLIFEVASGFGNVGLSLGCNTCGVASLSVAYSSFSKLIIIIVMICGPHRMIPQNVDRAITVPKKILERNEIRVSLNLDRRNSSSAADRPIPDGDKTIIN